MSSLPQTAGRIDRKQRGVAAVELAIMLPLFGILLLGVIEVGRLTRDHQVLQNAAREGARLSAMQTHSIADSDNPTTTEATLKNRIIAYLGGEGITVTAGDITINQAYEMQLGTSYVPASEITIVYTRPLLFPGIARWFTPTTTVRGKAIFRNFY